MGGKPRHKPVKVPMCTLPVHNKRQQLSRVLVKKLNVHFVVLEITNSTLQLRTEELTFETMKKLTDMFKTNNINIGAETQQCQYYPSTNPGSEAMLYLSDIKKWPN